MPRWNAGDTVFHYRIKYAKEGRIAKIFKCLVTGSDFKSLTGLHRVNKRYCVSVHQARIHDTEEACRNAMLADIRDTYSKMVQLAKGAKAE